MLSGVQSNVVNNKKVLDILFTIFHITYFNIPTTYIAPLESHIWFVLKNKHIRWSLTFCIIVVSFILCAAWVSFFEWHWYTFISMKNASLQLTQSVSPISTNSSTSLSDDLLNTKRMTIESMIESNQVVVYFRNF